MIKAYVDGSSDPNRKFISEAFVVFHNDHPIEMYKSIRIDSNTMRPHYYAMIAALNWLGIKGHRNATVFTDQSLVSDTYNDWMKGWHRRGWKKKGGPIKNLDLVKQLFDLKERYGIRVQWVKSLSHPGNVCARDLARSAIEIHLKSLKPKKKPPVPKIEKHLVPKPIKVLPPPKPITVIRRRPNHPTK